MEYRDHLLSLADKALDQFNWGDRILKGLQDAEKNNVLTPDLWKEYINSIDMQLKMQKEELQKLREEIKDAKQYTHLERKLMDLEMKLEKSLWKMEEKHVARK